MDAESKCPVMHGANTTNKGEGTTNRDWWPNQLDISILHQHDEKSNPCLLYTSPSPRDGLLSRMPSSA